MVTIKQVAKRAGLSASSVSKYLRDSNRIRPENREPIERAIRELNYIPSGIARAMRSGKAMTVKAVMPSVRHPFFAEIFENLHLAFDRAGYHLLLETLTDRQTFSHGEFSQVDGVIAAFIERSEVSSTLAEIMLPLDKSLVSINGFPLPDAGAQICVDMGAGMMKAARYMVENGRRKIAYVGGGYDERLRGFFSVVPEEMRHDVYLQDYTMPWGYQAGRKILESGSLPDGILCENDSIAVGVINYLRTHGILVPEKIWVIGFDNIPIAEMYYPSISSVSIPSQEMCDAAVEMLLDKINGRETATRTFECSLVLRKSTGANRL